MPNNSHENYLKVMRSFKKPSEASNISEIATAGAAQAPRVDSVRYPRNQKGSYIQAFVIGIDHALKGGCAKLYASRIMPSEGKRILTLGDVALYM
jgi:hypothetical protein